MLLIKDMVGYFFDEIIGQEPIYEYSVVIPFKDSSYHIYIELEPMLSPYKEKIPEDLKQKILLPLILLLLFYIYISYKELFGYRE
ncbi:MAG: hypothetical protein U9Q15_04570 [Patescibacteria group bacterium]|nr:hypothetical protein [Patescibacteria group bacterium]